MKKHVSHESAEKIEAKGAFYKAGEIIGSIGFHIVDGKDKAIGAVSDGLNMIKNVIKKKPVKKQKTGPKSKKVTKKKSSAASLKKSTKAARKKSAKKE